MKEITKVIKVYSFDELDEAAQERACQQIGDSMTSDDWWCEGIFEMFIERCREYGMEVDVNDIRAFFTCDNIDTKKLLHSLGIQVKDELKEKVLDYIYDVSIIRNSDQAYHERTVQAKVFIDDDALEEEEEEIRRYIHDIADTLEFKLEALKDGLCQQLSYDLGREYDYLYSAEFADELAYGNGMLFLEDGAVYSWGE